MQSFGRSGRKTRKTGRPLVVGGVFVLVFCTVLTVLGSISENSVEYPSLITTLLPGEDSTSISSEYSKPYRSSNETSAPRGSGSSSLGGTSLPVPPSSAPGVVSTPVLIPPTTPSVVETPSLPHPPQPVTDSLDYRYGISVASTLNNLSDSALAERLDNIQEIGVGWIRMDIGWDQVQTREGGKFNWTRIDRVVKAARARDLKVLGLLAYTPSFARVDDCYTFACAPRDPEEFAAFAGAAASHFKGSISAFEIWNEPNIALFWKPAPDPDAYAELLKQSYAAIKAVNGTVTVVSAGLSPAASKGGNIAPIDFLTALYANGVQGSFDALGHHPYSFPATAGVYQSWNAWSQMADTERSLRSVMIANGDADKKIWMTEYGAPTGGPAGTATLDNYRTAKGTDHVTEALQAVMVQEAFAGAQKYSWAGPLFWYSYKDLGTTEDTNENFFGLIRADGSSKPAYHTMRRLLGTE